VHMNATTYMLPLTNNCTLIYSYQQLQLNLLHPQLSAMRSKKCFLATLTRTPFSWISHNNYLEIIWTFFSKSWHISFSDIVWAYAREYVISVEVTLENSSNGSRYLLLLQVESITTIVRKVLNSSIKSGSSQKISQQFQYQEPIYSYTHIYLFST
jgi:hypothetical protein